MLERDRSDVSTSDTALQDETEHTIREIQTKVERLLDGYLAQDIEREVYLKKKADLLGQKKSLEEKQGRLKHAANAWLEPMAEWLNDAEKLKKIAQASDLFAKKVTAKEIFGSNLLLTQKNVVVVSPENVVNVVVENVVDPSENVVDPSENVVVVRKNVDQNVAVGGVKTQWTAVQAAHIMACEKPLSFVLAWLYNEARTYFQSKI
jgi:ribonucleotide reductase alpha subunit